MTAGESEREALRTAALLWADVRKFIRWAADIRSDTAEAIAIARALEERIEVSEATVLLRAALSPEPEPVALREYAGYLADAAEHAVQHMRSEKFYCEDADNIEHLIPKVRAALGEKP